jgi:hypothetical protein
MDAHVTPFNAETRSRRAAALFNKELLTNEQIGLIADYLRASRER